MPAASKPWLVFDMDGVLVDVRRSFPVAVRQTVGALGGGEVQPGEISRLKLAGGFNNDWDVTRELLRQRGISVSRARVKEVFDQIYVGRDGVPGLILQEGWLLAPALLDALSARFALAIFTGRPRADALFTLRHFGLEARFTSLIALEDVARQKPHPEGLQRLRQAAGAAGIAAYVGDTVDDRQCAESADVPFLGVAATLELRERLRPAQFLAENVGQIAAWLLDSAPD